MNLVLLDRENSRRFNTIVKVTFNSLFAELRPLKTPKNDQVVSALVYETEIVPIANSTSPCKIAVLLFAIIMATSFGQNVLDPIQ